MARASSINRTVGEHEARLAALEAAHARLLDDVAAIRECGERTEKLVTTYVERIRGGWKVLAAIGTALVAILVTLGKLLNRG